MDPGEDVSDAADPATGQASALQLPTASHNFRRKDMTPQEVEQVKQQFDQAIASLAMEKKQAYLEAVKQAPHVVAAETDFLLFIPISNGDLWAAAIRLCLYWTTRKTVFGDRAFLPLTLTGRGAMDKDDILCLQGCSDVMVPKTTDGKLILFSDRRQITPGSSPLNRFRCIFYLANVFSKFERAQTEGVYNMIVFVMPRYIKFDTSFIKKAWGFAANALPLKSRFRVLCQLPKGANFYVIQKMLTTYTKCMLDVGYEEEDINIHVAKSQDELLKEVVSFGMTLETIPTTIGGKWKYTNAVTWFRQRARQDRELENQRLKKSGLKRPRGAAAAEAANTQEPSTGNDASRTRRPRPSRTEEEKKAANAIYSRRKREKQRAEKLTLERELDSAKLENNTLKAEEKRLVQLLKKAEALVASLPASSRIGDSARDVEETEHETESPQTKCDEQSPEPSLDELHRGLERAAQLQHNQQMNEESSVAGNSLMQASLIGSCGSMTGGSFAQSQSTWPELDEISVASSVPSSTNWEMVEIEQDQLVTSPVLNPNTTNQDTTGFQTEMLPTNEPQQQPTQNIQQQSIFHFSGLNNVMNFNSFFQQMTSRPSDQQTQAQPEQQAHNPNHYLRPATENNDHVGVANMKQNSRHRPLSENAWLQDQLQYQDVMSPYEPTPIREC